MSTYTTSKRIVKEFMNPSAGYGAIGLVGSVPNRVKITARIIKVRSRTDRNKIAYRKLHMLLHAAR